MKRKGHWTEDLLSVFAELAEPYNLELIKREVSKEGKQKQKSTFVLDAFAAYVSNQPTIEQSLFEKCKNNEKDFMIRLIETTDPDTAERSIPYVQKLMGALYPKIGTRHVYNKQVRDAYKLYDDYNLDIYKQACKVIHITKKEHAGIKNGYAKTVYDRHKQQVGVSYNDVMDFIETHKDSTDWRMLTLVIGVSTGSRLIEILRVSDFQENTGYFKLIKVIGLAKDKGYESADVLRDDKGRRMLIKPTVGLTAKEVIHIVSSLRHSLSIERNWNLGTLPDGTETKGVDKTNSEITRSVSKGLQAKVRSYFDQSLTFHKLRAMYAEMAYMEDPLNERMTKTSYFSTVLGHRPNSLQTALSYERFKLVE